MPDSGDFNEDNYDHVHGEGAFQLLLDCDDCNGSGWLYDPSDGGTMTCGACDGTGKQEPEDWDQRPWPEQPEV